MSRLDLSHAIWRKSSRSNGNGNECVEVAFVDEVVALRDSKNPDGAALLFDQGGWTAFLHAAKTGKFGGA
jgi:Domain of unknown function (DUF397)